MLRTLEIGRAVVGSSRPNLELWLTAFITLLISHDDFGMQQMKTGSLLDLISSGNVWVGRGHDMHLMVELTLREEPLADEQLRVREESLLQAPMWTQLMLQPFPSTQPLLRPGTFRLNLGHAEPQEPKERLGSRQKFIRHIPAADIRPPDGVPTVSLHCVQLCMDLLEPRSPIVKRPRTSARGVTITHPEPESRTGDDACVTRAGRIEPTPDIGVSRNSDHSPLRHQTSSRKRRLTETESELFPIFHEQPTTTTNGTCEGITDLPLVESSLDDRRTHEESALIDSLIEGAIRITLTGHLGKQSNGSRVKASTFHRSLADIAPSLWKPGFAQQRISHRAHLIPIISRSLGKTISRTTSSSSLYQRSSGAATQQSSLQGHMDSAIVSWPRQDKELSTDITGLVWKHLQKNLANTTRYATPLLPCTGSVAWLAHSDSDEMLEESEH